MTWEDRFKDFLERVMANAVADEDPEPLKLELAKLLAERPKEGEGHVEGV